MFISHNVNIFAHKIDGSHCSEITMVHWERYSNRN